MVEFTNLTEYVASAKMTLKSKTHCLSFLSTIWRDKPILIVFNNLNNTVVDIWFEPVLQTGDFETLTKITKKYLIGIDRRGNSSYN